MTSHPLTSSFSQIRFAGSGADRNRNQINQINQINVWDRVSIWKAFPMSRWLAKHTLRRRDICSVKNHEQNLGDSAIRMCRIFSHPSNLRHTADTIYGTCRISSGKIIRTACRIPNHCQIIMLITINTFTNSLLLLKWPSYHGY